MAGISLLTALEIFSNPYDLEISLARPSGSSEYAFSITRGPGHRFKPLLDSVPFTSNLGHAVREVERILTTIRQAAADEFTTSTNVSRFLNPANHPLNQEKTLTHELVRRILKDLRENQAASTYLYERPSRRPREAADPPPQDAA